MPLCTPSNMEQVNVSYCLAAISFQMHVNAVEMSKIERILPINVNNINQF